MAKQNNPSAPVDEQYLMDVIAGGFFHEKRKRLNLFNPK
jgi:hypothetical protein